MIGLRSSGAVLAAAALLLSGACAAQSGSVDSAIPQAEKIAVTVETKAGPRLFNVEVARTAAQQERGLMFRTNLPEDGGMLFAPYPGDGGPPREADFWMKNTPSALDILFIRTNGTIARIAANAEPYSETNLRSGEPVSAVLEINGGVAARLGIAQGDKVHWAERK
jgi:uncharacterized protein